MSLLFPGINSALLLTELSGSEENVEFSQDLSPPRTVISTRHNSANRTCAHLTMQQHGSDTGHRKLKSKINGEFDLVSTLLVLIILEIR